MADKKQPKVNIVTPVGVAAYSYFHKPDTGNRFSDGKYKGKLVLPGDTDLSKIEEKIRAHAAAVFPGKDLSELQLPWKDGDPEKEEFAGKIILTAKSKYAPQVVDSKKRKLPKGVKALSGDDVRFVASLYAYEQTEEQVEKVDGKKVKRTVTIYGVSLQLNVVQVIAKNAGGGGLNELDEIDGWEPDEADGFGGDDADDEDNTSGDNGGDF